MPGIKLQVTAAHFSCVWPRRDRRRGTNPSESVNEMSFGRAKIVSTNPVLPVWPPRTRVCVNARTRVQVCVCVCTRAHVRCNIPMDIDVDGTIRPNFPVAPTINHRDERQRRFVKISIPATSPYTHNLYLILSYVPKLFIPEAASARRYLSCPKRVEHLS